MCVLRKDDLQCYFFQDICFSTVLPFMLVYVSLIYKIHDLLEIVPLSLSLSLSLLSCNLLLESFIGFLLCVKYLYTYCRELQEYIIHITANNLTVAYQICEILPYDQLLKWHKFKCLFDERDIFLFRLLITACGYTTLRMKEEKCMVRSK